MFVRPSWKPATDADIYDFIDEYPWALLVNNGSDGPFATNLPLLLDRTRGVYGTLIGHIAIQNAHASVLRSSKDPTLAIFQGPYSFITSSWYPNRDMPPTYYYTAVHCYGSVIIQDQPALEQALEILTERMESAFLNGWRTNEIPRSEITRRLPHIMGFEMEIQKIEGKFKLGQDEPRKDAMAVSRALSESSDAGQRTLSEMIRKYNEKRPEKV